MFSGIVSAVGRVEALPSGAAGELLIAPPPNWGQFEIGDSVAVNGCCLTVVRREQQRLAVEVMPETLRRTNLGQLLIGGPVNLESALSLGAPVGGHLMSGHVDATGVVAQVDREGNARWVRLHVPAQVGRYCVAQGSIGIDGCSLTLVSVQDAPQGGAEVSISLIPHTVATTVAGNYRPGSVVNLEVDSVARLIERLLAPHLGPGPGLLVQSGGPALEGG
ncbi:MAG TPA: riboflavin synthase [Candidatus Dormibacteraeota bacterium]|nr:riboflavin synthase [Candidatus Dormibacteraeota bacterium]